MPYIRNIHRAALERPDPPKPMSSGELNYCITRLIDAYVRMCNTPLTYTHINEVIGVLECAKLEFYRRVAVPYETAKMEENGDVYGLTNDN